MSATVISLADYRRRTVPVAAQPEIDPDAANTFRLLAQIARNLGHPPGHKGKWVVTRRPQPE